jgi:hypothetical protein
MVKMRAYEGDKRLRWTKKKDEEWDRMHGVKQGTKRDLELDKKRGVKPSAKDKAAMAKDRRDKKR